MNENIFRSEVTRGGYTLKSLCEEIGMAQSTMTRKIKNNSFTIAEAEVIGDTIGISRNRLGSVFFTPRVT